MDAKIEDIQGQMLNLFGKDKRLVVSCEWRYSESKWRPWYTLMATFYHKACEKCGDPKEEFIHHYGTDLDQLFEATKKEYKEITSK